jgi:pimeloyl-ACP methyl ester carboxylesterase
MNMDLRTIDADGSRLTYMEQGTGVPLVLLHGVGSGARSWVRQLDTLSARCRVIAWDGPGYGDSIALPMDAPGPDKYIDALLKLVDALGVDRMHLVGHSLGAIQAARFARRHPERLLGLTLASMAAEKCASGCHQRQQGAVLQALRWALLARPPCAVAPVPPRAGRDAGRWRRGQLAGTGNGLAVRCVQVRPNGIVTCGR